MPTSLTQWSPGPCLPLCWSKPGLVITGVVPPTTGPRALSPLSPAAAGALPRTAGVQGLTISLALWLQGFPTSKLDPVAAKTPAPYSGGTGSGPHSPGQTHIHGDSTSH